MFRSSRRAVFACTATLLPVLAFAQASGPIQPFLPPTGFALQSNSMKGANGRPALYGAARPDANWYFAPMGNPGDLPALAPGPDGASWSASAPWGSAKFSLQNNLPTETIMQNGGALACTSLMGMPHEYDMSITPNGKNSGYPTAVNPALYASNQAFPSLGQLASFTLSGTFTVDVASQAVPVSPCRVNHAGAGYGVILIDTKVNPHQMFWYTVLLTHACMPVSATDPGPEYQNCQAIRNHRGPIWFWSGAGGAGRHVSMNLLGGVTTAHYAVGDPLTSYGVNLVNDNEPHALSLDLLSRLTTLITSGKDQIDPDLTHWRVAGVSFGQELWGDTLFSTTWQGFVPTWTVKPGA